MPVKTIVFIDWDDTLLATTHLQNKKYGLFSPKPDDKNLLQNLETLSATVDTLLTKISNKCDIFIVTNAEEGWIELTSTKFLSSASKKISDFRAISAKTLYGTNSTDPVIWKQSAFKQCFTEYISKSNKDKHCIISIGDSNAERLAVQALKSENTLIKSIKMVELPDIIEVINQLKLITKNFNEIHKLDTDIDLYLSKQEQINK